MYYLNGLAMALIQCLGSMECSIVDFLPGIFPSYICLPRSDCQSNEIFPLKIIWTFFLYLNGYVCVCICKYIQNLHFFPCITFFKTNND